MTTTTLEIGEEEKLGQFLRRERTKKGIFLSEISEKTCVRTYYLESIEEGNFHKLPPTLIARGFVRAYADYLGLDSDAAAQQFNLETGNQSSVVDLESDESSETQQDDKPHSARGMVQLLGGAFYWIIPRKRKRPAVDLGDFMDQIEGSSNKERITPEKKES